MCIYIYRDRERERCCCCCCLSSVRLFIELYATLLINSCSGPNVNITLASCVEWLCYVSTVMYFPYTDYIHRFAYLPHIYIYICVCAPPLSKCISCNLIVKQHNDGLIDAVSDLICYIIFYVLYTCRYVVAKLVWQGQRWCNIPMLICYIKVDIHYQTCDNNSNVMCYIHRYIKYQSWCNMSKLACVISSSIIIKKVNALHPCW